MMDTPNGFHVSDGWLHFGNQKVPSFSRVRATLSGNTGCFVAMTDEGRPIFAWHDHDKSACNCQHTHTETYPPDGIPPIELVTKPSTEPTEEEQREMEECKTVMRRTGYVEGAVSQVPMSDAGNRRLRNTES